jgi:hypothetical protein
MKHIKIIFKRLNINQQGLGKIKLQPVQHQVDVL